MKKNKKIAVLTSGGDAPGMNKYLSTLYEYAINNNIELTFIENGFEGLSKNWFKNIDYKFIQSQQNLAGSCIYSSRYKEFHNEETLLNAKTNLDNNQIDCLIVLGGNGSFDATKKLSLIGVNVIFIPCTIDNDLIYSEYSIGFDSALNAAIDTIDQLKSSIDTHQQIIFVEVMGNNCADLTIGCGLATNADYTITKFNKKNENEILQIIKKMSTNKKSLLIVLSELIYDQNETKMICEKINKETNIKAKYHAIGFVQRGAKPSAWDRLIATNFAINTIQLVINKEFNKFIGWKNNNLLIQDISKIKEVNQEKQTQEAIVLKKMNKGD